jgi:anti-sigma factor RsiW
MSEPPMPEPAFDESFLSAYLDGALDGAQGAAVERRLADAPELRALLDELRVTRESVRALPAVDAPPGFWDRLLEPDDAGDAPVHQIADARTRRRRTGRRWLALPSAAAAAVLVAVVLVPHPTRVRPRLSTLTESHAERSSVENDPISNLAPVSADAAP